MSEWHRLVQTMVEDMAFINEPTGRICSWGIPLAESYGVRLPVYFYHDCERFWKYIRPVKKL